MNILRISPDETSINTLLQQAYHHNMVVQVADGTLFFLARITDHTLMNDDDQAGWTFDLGDVGDHEDDFEAEVEATQQNEELMQFLRTRAAQATPGKDMTIEEIRQQLQNS